MKKLLIVFALLFTAMSNADINPWILYPSTIISSAVASYAIGYAFGHYKYKGFSEDEFKALLKNKQLRLKINRWIMRTGGKKDNAKQKIGCFNDGDEKNEKWTVYFVDDQVTQKEIDDCDPWIKRTLALPEAIKHFIDLKTESYGIIGFLCGFFISCAAVTAYHLGVFS